MTPAAEIQRRYRARQRAGLRVIPVVVDAALVEDALIARGFLRSEDADDNHKVAAALRAAIAMMITPLATPVMDNAFDFRDVLVDTSRRGRR
jgi:hypothetical protein